MAGLPGTGLGGLFYALLTLFVALREAYLTYQQRSSDGRRSLAFRMFAFVILIAGVFWLEGYLVMHVVHQFNDAYAIGSISQQGVAGALFDLSGPRPERATEPVPGPGPEPLFQPAFRPVPEAIVPALAWTPFIFLGIVLGGVQVLRIFVLWQARSSGYRP